jgi:hypothetical protein
VLPSSGRSNCFMSPTLSLRRCVACHDCLDRQAPGCQHPCLLKHSATCAACTRLLPAGFWAVQNFVRPLRISLALALAPAFDKAITRLGEKLNIPKGW